MLDIEQALSASPSEFALLFAGIALALMVLEYLAGCLAHHNIHDVKETTTSLVIAIGTRLIRSLEAGIVAVPFILAYNNRLVDFDSTSVFAVVMLFFAVEFVYYWHHRASHTIRWLWATHSVHHTPTRFNLTAGIRLGWTGAISGHFLFYVPLALIGFHPMLIAAVLGANLGYQFFIHTTLAPRLGPLEWVLNTPTHHSVHHASNASCLDKNFGGTLIIFDRIFGTFAAPPEDEPLRYGVVGRNPSYHPFKVLFAEWSAIFCDLRNSKHSFAVWFKILFGPPHGPSNCSDNEKNIEAT